MFGTLYCNVYQFLQQKGLLKFVRFNSPFVLLIETIQSKSFSCRQNLKHLRIRINLCFALLVCKTAKSQNLANKLATSCIINYRKLNFETSSKFCKILTDFSQKLSFLYFLYVKLRSRKPLQASLRPLVLSTLRNCLQNSITNLPIFPRKALRHFLQ